jgi:hypothetical protein
MTLLEQLPKIINAAGNHQQAAQGIGHCMEDPGTLYEKDIDQCDDRVDNEEEPEQVFCFRAVDDLTQQKEIESKIENGRKATEQLVVYRIIGDDIRCHFQQ